MRRLPAAAWAALAAAPVAVFVALNGLRDHYRFADEAIGIFGGRQLQADFWGSVLDPQFSSRPLERGLALLWAAMLEIAPTSAGAFQLFHVVLAIVAASAAIPVALLLRGLGVRTGWAVAGGVIAVTGPWAIFGVTLLNNAPGMTSVAWLVLAGQRVVRQPGWRSDLLFCLAALLVGVVRAGNVPLAAGIAPAVLWAAWVRGGSRPAGLVVELVRRHWVLVAVAAAGALVLAVRGFAGLFGSYGAGRSTYLPWDLLLPGIRNLGGHLAVATGIVAFGLAVPWIARAVLRPREAGVSAERTFGLTAIGMALVFVYVYMPALNEDRYFLALTPLIVVPFVHAVTARPLGLGWLAGGAGVLAFFLARGTYWPDSPDAYIQVPAAQWWNRVVEGRISEVSPIDQSVVAVVLFSVLVLAAGVALVRGGPRARRLTPAIVLGAVLVHQAAAAGYTVDRWVELRGLPDMTFAQRTFADRATPGDTGAMLLRANPAGVVELPFSWDDVAFWNQEVAGTLDVKDQPPCCFGGNFPLQWDEHGQVQTGLLAPYVVTPLPASAALAGRTVAVEPSQGYSVVRVAEPARMAYVATDADAERVSLQVWPRNAPGARGESCLVGDLDGVAVATIDGRRAVVDRRGRADVLRLPDAQALDVELLHGRDRGPSDVRLAGCGAAAPGGR